MITNMIGQGSIKISQEEFNKIPSMEITENSSQDLHIFKYKFMDMYGKWNIVDIVHDEETNAVKFLCRRVEIDG